MNLNWILQTIIQNAFAIEFAINIPSIRSQIKRTFVFLIKCFDYIGQWRNRELGTIFVAEEINGWRFAYSTFEENQ